MHTHTIADARVIKQLWNPSGMVSGPPDPESVSCRCIQRCITLHAPNPGLRFLASHANRGTHADYSHMLCDSSGMWMEDEVVCGSGGRQGTRGLMWERWKEGISEGSERGAVGFLHREKNPSFRQKINSVKLHSTSAEPSRQKKTPKTN